ncbi:coiled-coil domain-containing protein 9-like isoform X2 [Hetaerina americana]|uniref:coiled-coil domain-containing protein 9-like isoform X2 n=1 Tax=Hetaerina americana TaxID=62018 RepID=UPI003A7F3B30
MSQKDPEAAIDEKIERIRRKNEEIKRRYLEVEADKLNAEKLNATVKFTPSETKKTERKPFGRPPATNRNPRFEKRVPDKPYTAKLPSHGKKFTDGDGPPPDPVYTFLSDHSRDEPRGDYSPDAKRGSSTPSDEAARGPGRVQGWNKRGRGSPIRGSRRGGSQPSRQGPQFQPEYQAWRAEREKIDQDRITRQKTAEGNWRREWDSEKLFQEGNQEYKARPAFSKKKKRDGEDVKIQRTISNEMAKASSYSTENEPRFLDNSVKSDCHPKEVLIDKKSVAFTFSEVNPVNTAGTGRVGPRQKPLLSYSSQSEDEKESHSTHTFHKRTPPTFGHKEAVPLPPRNEASSRKPPLPPSRGFGHELSSPKKNKAKATKAQPAESKREVERPPAERKELSRESSHENVSEGGDDSWEDVATTSGNESADCSDADMIKKSDGSEKSISRDQHIDNVFVEEVPKIMTAPEGEHGKLGEGGGISSPGEYCEQTDVYDDTDQGTEVQQSEEICKAAEEGGDVADVAVYQEHGHSSSVERELHHDEQASVDLVESRHEGEGTKEEEESPKEGDGPTAPAIKEVEGRLDRDVSSAQVEPTVEEDKNQEGNTNLSIREDSAASLKGPGKEDVDLGNILSTESRSSESPSHISTDLPELPQKKDGSLESKAAETEENKKVANEELTLAGSLEGGISISEPKDTSEGTSVSNNPCSPNT